MKRIHFIELEDQDWCPTPIRDVATDYLRFATRMNNIYAPAVPLLRAVLERLGARRVLDLCSGGGGPRAYLHERLTEEGWPVEVILSDFRPNLGAFEHARAEAGDAVAYVAEPVDATRVPEHLEGFRTIFTGFHHFRPEQARAILSDAVEQGRGIAIFEATERTVPAVLAMLLMPFVVLLVTPLIRPFRWSRLFWTYLAPAVPLVVLWDGIVSCLRTYTPDELRQMTRELDSEAYRWEIGQRPIGKGPISMTYLIGYAAEPSETHSLRA